VTVHILPTALEVRERRKIADGAIRVTVDFHNASTESMMICSECIFWCFPLICALTGPGLFLQERQ
jgi:hypothetical protein